MWYKTPGAAAGAKQVTILECLVYEHRLCTRTERGVLCRVKPVQPTQETPRVSETVYTWPRGLPRAPTDSSSWIWWISYLVWHLGGRGFGNSESCLGFLTAIWCIYHRAYSRAKHHRWANGRISATGRADIVPLLGGMNNYKEHHIRSALISQPEESVSNFRKSPFWGFCDSRIVGKGALELHSASYIWGNWSLETLVFQPLHPLPAIDLKKYNYSTQRYSKKKTNLIKLKIFISMNQCALNQK